MILAMFRKTPIKILAPVLLLVVVILTVAVAAFIHGYYVINPDGVSYISIASHYASGHLNDAINAYWSPMLSWLMVPYILLGVEPIVAYMINNLLASVAIVWIFGHIIHKYITTNRLVLLSSCLAVIMFLLSRSFSVVTPDIMVVLWILIYTVLLINIFRQGFTIKRAIMVGLLGALGYLTKLYLLPVFVASITIFVLFLFFRRKSLKIEVKNLAKSSVIIILAMAVLSGVWVTTLSVKYDKFMVGSAFGFTMTSNKPGDEGIKDVLATTLPVSNQHALTAWEDPTFISRGGKFSPSAESIVHMIKHRFNVMDTYMNTINSMSPIILLSPLFLVVLYLFRRKDSEVDSAVIVAAIVLFVYIGGYTLIGQSDNQRYLWPLFILAALIYTAFISLIIKQIQHRAGSGILPKLILVSILPLLIVLQNNGSLRSAVLDTPTGYYYKNTSQAIIDSNLMQADDEYVTNSFYFSQRFAHYLQKPTLGVVEPADKNLCQIMDSKNIDFYIYTYKKNESLAKLPSCLSIVKTIDDENRHTSLLRLDI